MRYPNLNSIVRWHSFGIPTFADHAGVTIELFEEVLKGGEELSDMELFGIVRLVGIPFGVLKQPKVIFMNNKKFQHCQKVEDLQERYQLIKSLRTREGYERNTDLVVAGQALEDFVRAFEQGNGTYCRYKTVLDKIKWNEWLYLNNDVRKPRGLKNAPATDQSTQGANKTQHHYNAGGA